jgi:hypothetical protein
MVQTFRMGVVAQKPPPAQFLAGIARMLEVRRKSRGYA